MSTEIYPPLPEPQITEIEEQNTLLERHWLIVQLIKPELDNVLDALARCLDLVTSQDEVKLPLTSSRTEQAKGILTRRSSEVANLDMTLHLHTFSKQLRLKLKRSAHIEMEQLTQLTILINDTITAVLILKDIDTKDGPAFKEQLSRVLQCLTRCNTMLNKPPERLLFPQHSIDITEIFEPDGNKVEHYKDRIAMDFFLLNGEVSVEIKSLHLVTEEPWCHVDRKTGKSYVEQAKEDLKNNTKTREQILNPEGYQRGISRVLGINKFTNEDYFFRGITFNGRVVVEVEKTVIHCQDPHLLSVGSKLSGLEHLVSRMYANLDLACLDK